jgi:hypothetical protein
MHFVFLVFLDIAAGNLHSLLTALVPPPECLSESTAVRFLTLPPLLIGGLLGEGGASQLLLHPPPTHLD